MWGWLIFLESTKLPNLYMRIAYLVNERAPSALPCLVSIAYLAHSKIILAFTLSSLYMLFLINGKAFSMLHCLVYMLYLKHGRILRKLSHLVCMLYLKHGQTLFALLYLAYNNSISFDINRHLDSDSSFENDSNFWIVIKFFKN